MGNIIYALTNPAMPGLVKIGMTDRPDVQDRMRDLYTTGTPLPFDCIIAWELAAQIAAADAEQAFHRAFDPHRVNPGREFFELDPEQVVPLVRLLPGRDVTPSNAEQSSTDDPDDDDRAAATDFKRRRNRTDKAEFLESVTPNGRVVYERVLTLANQDGIEVRWGRKAFTMYVESSGAVICRGYPQTAFRQLLRPDLWSLHERANVPQEVLDDLDAAADQTGLFERIGKYDNLACQTDRPWDEAALQQLIRWLTTVIARARGKEPPG